jgi:hypothetical protein
VCDQERGNQLLSFPQTSLCLDMLFRCVFFHPGASKIADVWRAGEARLSSSFWIFVFLIKFPGFVSLCYILRGKFISLGQECHL